MAFNRLFAHVSQPLARAALLLAWPLAGLVLLHETGADVPEPLLIWALATSALYALRLLALRDLGTWTGFLATSVWALLWIPAREGFELEDIALDALGLTVPLVLLVLVTVLLNRRLGGAYTSIRDGIASSLPRMSVTLIICLLAAVATPPFPGFFSLLSLLMLASPVNIAGLLIVWLLWSWAAARLIQGFVVGTPAQDSDAQDISLPLSWGLAMVLTVLLLSGVMLTGELL
jgi:NADH:ubiquinone oxidoreductase subunit 2 (subunit N)